MDVDHGTGDSQAQKTEEPVSRINGKMGGFQTIAGAIVLARIGAFAIEIDLGRVFIGGMQVEKGVLGLKPGKEELEIHQRG